MSTLQADPARPTSRHTHKPNGLASDTQCPYCGQPISRKEFKKIQGRIESEEKARLAKLERALTEKATVEIHRAKLHAAELAEQHIKKVQAEREADKLHHAAEKLRLETALAELQRKVAAKPAHQIGEPAEIDLFEELTAAFPTDRISRVTKGVQGPDLFIEILDANIPIGCIAVECKQHSRWSNRFVSKLKGDAENADYGILSTSIMPSAANGSRLHVIDGIIIVDPSLVPPLVGLLRRQILELHRQKLTGRARDDKAAALLTYIASGRCRDQFDKFTKLSSDLADLDAKETASHETVWRKRRDLIRSLSDAQAEFVTNVDRIIAGHLPEASS